MLVCVSYGLYSLFTYMYAFTVFNLYVYVPLYSTKGIDDVALIKNIKFVYLLSPLPVLLNGLGMNYTVDKLAVHLFLLSTSEINP